jgi:hypothetical protein
MALKLCETVSERLFGCRKCVALSMGIRAGEKARTREIVEMLEMMARDREGGVLAFDAEDIDDRATEQWLRGRAKEARQTANVIRARYPEAFAPSAFPDKGEAGR